MTSKRTKITLMNLKPPYNMEAHTLQLASPHRTDAVQQVLVYETGMTVSQLYPSDETTDVLDDDSEKEAENDGDAPLDKATKEDDDDQKEEARLPVTSESLYEVLKDSHTILVPDALFLKSSKVFYTETFIDQGGLQVLQKLYQEDGATILVLCLEGQFAVTRELNRLFHTQWSMKFFDAGTEVVPTEAGRTLLGPFAPSQPHLTGNPHFVECPAGEGLYTTKMQSKEEFVVEFHAQDEQFEKLGIEPDASMDCFNVEKSWTNYVTKYTDRHVIAVHRHEASGGHVVWYGDRGQSETMAYVFCKMLNLGGERVVDLGGGVRFDVHESLQRADGLLKRQERARRFGGVVVLSLLALILFMLAKLLSWATLDSSTTVVDADAHSEL